MPPQKPRSYRTNKHGRDVIAKIDADSPRLSSQQLARTAYAQAPECFSSLQAAIMIVRRMRGASLGKVKTKKPAPLPPTVFKSHAGRVDMPTALDTFKDWRPYIIDGPAKILVMSDIHIPYHDEAAVAAAIAYGRKNKTDTLLLNGDICDFFALSRWETDPRERDFETERDKTVQFFGHIRSLFPKAPIVWKLGNHEERYQSYMMQKAPEIFGLPEFDIAAIFHTEEYGIEVVKEMRPVHAGKLPIVHGHEYKFAISNPVNPARGLFLKAKTSALCGHHHQRSEHSEKDLHEKQHTTYSTGCLCNLRYKYAPINNHSHGFAVVTVEADGGWHVDNRKIIKGRVW